MDTDTAASDRNRDGGRRQRTRERVAGDGQRYRAARHAVLADGRSVDEYPALAPAHPVRGHVARRTAIRAATKRARPWRIAGSRARCAHTRIAHRDLRG